MTAPRTYTQGDICLGSVPAMQGTEEWRRIGAIISDISEDMYCAGWMQHAEYDVYRLMTEGGRWGMGCASDAAEQLGALRSLSRRHEVWVTWCEDHGQEPIRLDQWKPVYVQWRAKYHRFEIDRQRADPHEYDDGDAAPSGDLCLWCLARKP